MEPNNKLAPPLDSAEARRLINQWSSKGLFRVRGLGSKITVDERTAKLLKKSQSVPEGQTRLLFQHLHIEYVSIQEVRYRYHNSSLKSLWIYGGEHSTASPINGSAFAGACEFW
jgi:hypothetical protein